MMDYTNYNPNNDKNNGEKRTKSCLDLLSVKKSMTYLLKLLLDPES
jgi:hypothetical protein